MDNATSMVAAANRTLLRRGGLDPNSCAKLALNMVNASDPFLGREDIRTVIIVLYSTIIAIGSAGNGLVILTILLKPEMRNLRNYFILMLATSDFIMCTITVPFTMKTVLQTFWEYGPWLCKIVTGAQACNVFVSTFSITAISLDRYFLITFPTNVNMQRYAVVGSFALVWAISIGMAVPYFLSTSLHSIFLPDQAYILWKSCGLDYSVCSEDDTGWFTSVGRQIYTVGCFIFQYLLPLSGLIFMNVHMTSRLEHQREFRSLSRRLTDSVKDADARNTDLVASHRQKKFKRLILAVVLTFALSWLPWNVYMTVLAFKLHEERGPEQFAFCHCVGMLSACVNPILYGLLNENFKRAYSAIFKRCAGLKDVCSGRKETVYEEIIGGNDNNIVRLSTYARAQQPHNSGLGPLLEETIPIKSNCETRLNESD